MLAARGYGWSGGVTVFSIAWGSVTLPRGRGSKKKSVSGLSGGRRQRAGGGAGLRGRAATGGSREDLDFEIVDAGLQGGVMSQRQGLQAGLRALCRSE